MLKFVHAFKHYYLGFSLIGVLAFVIQEIPYIIMPLVKPESNPIMNMIQYHYPLVCTATIFFLIHTANGYMNFIVKK